MFIYNIARETVKDLTQTPKMANQKKIYYLVFHILYEEHTRGERKEKTNLSKISSLQLSSTVLQSSSLQKDSKSCEMKKGYNCSNNAFS